MQCPVDGAMLTMSERSGIEIDYCPQCRGVWLDRGELDKIIERSADHSAPPPRRDERSYGQQPDQPRYGQQSYGQKPYKAKRKESWLSELFD